MLFSETASLADDAQTKDVPRLVLYHHLVVRSGVIPLPHQMHGWQEAEYVKFVCEHSDAENRRLVEAAVQSWDKDDPQNISEETRQCIDTLKAVLERDRMR